jgi:hypothetical protein
VRPLRQALARQVRGESPCFFKKWLKFHDRAHQRARERSIEIERYNPVMV